MKQASRFANRLGDEPCFRVAALLLVGHRRSRPIRGCIYEGNDGPGKGKHIVLISGDEEYRSEEALPQLAKILANEHGFDCTVLFAIDPETGFINPNTRQEYSGARCAEECGPDDRVHTVARLAG